ncbi:jg2051 [Pararge aegeria aegeria]|uniref:Jg2051 protein n=1 Tax=Pararge aegeria aegeria TaxID=348720 RepID=A0A8S4RHS1_9NEOP|nr:jg2051 [Pararge aegeria aegeria]
MTLVCSIGFMAAATASDKIGRRWPYIFFSSTMTINWIILYYAREMYQFMLSRFFGGVSVGALLTLNLFVISEFTSPDTRPFFLNIVAIISPAIGTGMGHILGILMHWRNVALVGLGTAVLGAILPFFWVESPHWLASKGRFEECQTAFRILHGETQNSERELQLLIKMEKSKLEVAKQTNCKPTLKRLAVVLKKKYFWDSILLSLFMDIYLVASGKVPFSLLGSVIIEDITGSSDVFAFTTLVDGLLLLGPCLSCFFIKRTSIRTMLFTTGFTANAILIVFSACLYFSNDQSYFNWINIGLLGLYFIIMNAGPFPLLEAIYSEMFPLELKLYIFTISGGILMFGFSLSVFLLPYMVRGIGYHGMFIVNALLMTLSLGYIWWKLPETKGKSLQEIEMYFKTKNFDVEEVLGNEQLKALI